MNLDEVGARLSLDDVLDFEEERLELELRLEELDFERSKVERIISQQFQLTGSVDWANFNMIDIETVSQLLNRDTVMLDPKIIEVEKRVELAQKEIDELVKKETWYEDLE